MVDDWSKPSPAGPEEKWAVVVVHGVGDPGGPGRVLDGFLGPLAATSTSDCEIRPDGVSAVRFLQEPGGATGGRPTERVETFPVHVRRASVCHAGDSPQVEAVFFELYWADLTRVKEGAVSLLVALGKVLFSSHHTVRAMVGPLTDGGLDRRSLAERLLYASLRLTDWLLCGAVAVLGTLMGVYLLMRVVVWHLWYQRTYDGIPAEVGTWMMLVAGAACLVVGLLGRAFRPWGVRRVYWAWLAVVGSAAVALVGVQLTRPAPRGVGPGESIPAFTRFDHYIRGKYLSSGDCVAEDVEKAKKRSARLNAREEPYELGEDGRYDVVALEHATSARRPAWYCSVILEALFWVCLLLSLSLVLALLLASALVLRRPGGTGPLLRPLTAWVAAAMQAGLWAILFPTLLAFAVKADPNFKDAAIQQDPLVLRGSVLLLHLLMAVFLCITAGCVWLARQRRPFVRAALVNTPEKRPRLIVSRAIEVVVILFFLAWTAFLAERAAVPALGDLPFGEALSIRHRLDQMRALLPRGEDYLQVFVSAVLAVVVVAGSFLLRGVRQALHIVNDVTSHFTFGRAGVATPPTYVVRERIEGRLRAILDTLRREESPRRLIVVGHSQGTVIAFDVLTGTSVSSGNDGAPLPVALVTMGSPIHHLYRHYFPRQYPPGGNQAVLRRLALWLNLYRPDDYVGTTVSNGGTPCVPAGGPAGTFEEYCLESSGHGHTGYWTQAEVLDLIRKIAFGP